MRNAGKKFDRALSLLTTLVLIGTLLQILANALSRHFLDSPLAATNELVAYWYMPILALVGFSVAHIRREHIQVSLIVSRLHPANRRDYQIFGRCLGIVLFIGLSWFGFAEALKNLSVGMTAGVTSLVIWPVSFLVPAAFILLSVLFFLDIMRAVRTGDMSPKEEEVLELEPITS